MAVSAPFNTAGLLARNTDTSPLDLTMTINSGHLTAALLVWVAWNAAGVTVSSVTWDPAGANEVLSSLGAALNFNTNWNIQGFVRKNPTAGASKVVRVAYSADAEVVIGALVCDGVDQTTPTANLTSNTTGAGLAITAASGDLTTTIIVTSNTVDASGQTLIDLDLGFNLTTGFDYALATGTMTHTWSATGGTQAVMGVALKASSGSSDTLFAQICI